MRYVGNARIKRWHEEEYGDCSTRGINWQWLWYEWYGDGCNGRHGYEAVAQEMDGMVLAVADESSSAGCGLERGLVAIVSMATMVVLQNWCWLQ